MTILTCGQLSDVAHTLGGNLYFQRELPGEQPVLDGEQQVQVLSEGLVLYFSHSRDLVDASSDNRLTPGITAAFLLQGEAEVSLPRQRLHFDARPGGQRAMLVNLTDSDQFQRHWRSGREETKVCLSITRIGCSTLPSAANCAATPCCASAAATGTTCPGNPRWTSSSAPTSCSSVTRACRR